MYYEDILFTPTVLSKVNRIAVLDIPYYNYVRGRDGSIMTEPFSERYLTDEKMLLKEQICFFENYGDTELVEKARIVYCDRLLFYAYHIYNNKINNKFHYAKEIRCDMRRMLSEPMKFTNVNQKKLMELCAYSTFLYYLARNMLMWRNGR